MHIYFKFGDVDKSDADICYTAASVPKAWMPRLQTKLFLDNNNDSM